MIVARSERYNHEKTLFYQMLQEPSVIALVFDFALEIISLMKTPCNKNSCIKNYGQSFTPMSLLVVCQKNFRFFKTLTFKYPKIKLYVWNNFGILY